MYYCPSVSSRAATVFMRPTSSQRRSVAFQAAMPPFVGAFFPRAAALFRPGDRPRHRTLRDIPFAACRYAGQDGILRRVENPALEFLHFLKRQQRGRVVFP
jgi:hypothetical protein